MKTRRTGTQNPAYGAELCHKRDSISKTGFLEVPFNYIFSDNVEEGYEEYFLQSNIDLANTTVGAVELLTRHSQTVSGNVWTILHEAGSLPGPDIAESAKTDFDFAGSSTGYFIARMNIPGGAAIPGSLANGVNLEFKCAISSGDYITTQIYVGNIYDGLGGQSVAYYQYGGIDWTSNFGSFSGIRERDMTFTVYGHKPLASRELTEPVDCSKATKFRVAVKSDLAGNVLDFVYGDDKTNAKTEHLNISGSGDWATISIPISETTDSGGSIDLSNLKYFSFRRGRDGINTDGTGKAYTINIDQLEAF
ncbi:MAG: hypothetical protein HZC51_12240 [Nitrospirae bacterium]|nr:hypothetical protein [Nitrospirota bacterium]